MALVFPLTKPNFMNKLPIEESVFEAPTQRQVTGLRNGEIVSAEVAPALWQGRITLKPMGIAAAAEIIALLSALEVPGNSFFVYNPDRAGPAYDSDGNIVNGLSPTISAFDANASTVDIAGLTNGYVISPGDMVSWEYDTGPRYALHRFVEGATVAGGLTGDLQVYPHIRQPMAVSAAVLLRKAIAKAYVVPGTTDFGVTRGRTVSGIAFDWRQTLG